MGAHLRDDHGGLVLGWLFKVALTLALLGLLAFDGIALGVAKVSSTDAAATVASTAADQYKNSKHNAEQAYQAAEQAAVDNGVTLAAKDLVFYPDGEASATVHRTVHTIVLQYLPFARSFLHITATAVASPTLQ
jgi:hypothetical protein